MKRREFPKISTAKFALLAKAAFAQGGVGLIPKQIAGCGIVCKTPQT